METTKYPVMRVKVHDIVDQKEKNGKYINIYGIIGNKLPKKDEVVKDIRTLLGSKYPGLVVNRE